MNVDLIVYKRVPSFAVIDSSAARWGEICSWIVAIMIVVVCVINV